MSRRPAGALGRSVSAGISTSSGHITRLVTSARLGVVAKFGIARPKAFLVATALGAALAVERLLAARSLDVDFAGFAMVQERR